MGSHGANTEVTRQSSARTFVIERPDQVSAELVGEAMRNGVEEFICGFLPDEVEWIGEGEWFFGLCERFRFSPFVFEVPGDVAAVEDRVLLIVKNVPAIEEEFMVLAKSLSDAMKWELRVFDVAGRSIEAIASEVAAATVVLNDVQDWSLGFAVDELAATLGRRVLRLKHPGYSPIRYALLGYELPAIWSTGADSIRPILLPLMQESPLRAVPGLRNWFTGTEHAKVWREWYSAPAFRRMWPTVDPRWIGGSAGSGGVRWLERPAAWAMVVAATRSRKLSSDQVRVLHSIVARWAGYDPPQVRGAMIRELGLARLTRIVPEWMQTLPPVIRENRNVRRRRDSWIEAAIGWEPCEALALPVVQHIEGMTFLEKERQMVLKWRNDWSQAADAISANLRPTLRWRMTCAEAFWKHATSGVLTDNEADVVDPHFGDASFSNFFGDAAPVLRFFVALRVNGFATAFSTLRAMIRDSGLPVSPYWVSIARRSFDGETNWLQWLRSQTRRESGKTESTLLSLMEQWLLRNRRELWRRDPSRATWGHLEFICQALDTLLASSGHECADGVLATKVRACSIAGYGKTAIETIETSPVEGVHRSPVLGSVVALNLWRRSCLEEARSVIASRPLNQSIPPFHVFLRAVAAQLLGCNNELREALGILAQKTPGFFAEYGSVDPRWAWMAILFKMDGKIDRANYMHRRAVSICDPGHAFLLDLFGEVEKEALALSSDWKKLPGLFA